MKVSTENVGTREVALTFEPDARTIQRAMRKAARDISRMRPVPGFRPGKAPYGMVERIFGREVILNEALNDVAPDLYRQAVEEANLQPYEQGELDIESEDPLVLRINVSLAPSVDLGDYAGIAIEPEPAVVVSQEQIDEALEAERRRHADYETVERPAATGDQVVAKIAGTADGDQVIDQEAATLILSDELMPPGFDEALSGMSAGEEREFTLAYPEDFDNEDLAGKNVDFAVSMTTVRQVNLPDVDDDLAKMAGDYDTLQELREGLADRIQKQMQYEADQREQRAAIDALVAGATVEYPPAALRDEVDRAIMQQRGRLEQIGFSWENYLRMTGHTEADIREQIEPDATKALIERLVLSEYARTEELKLSPEQMNSTLQGFQASVMSAYGEQAQEMMQRFQQNGTFINVIAEELTQLAIRRLTAAATGRPFEEEAEETAEAAGDTDEAVAEEASQSEASQGEGSDTETSVPEAADSGASEADAE